MSAEAFRPPAEGRFAIGDPYRGPETADALAALHETSLGFVAAFDDDEFVRQQGEHWSPADHVRHLRRSCRPVATALAAPKMVLGLRFGRSRVDSGRLADVVGRYHAALAAGGSADGSAYEPPRVDIEGPVGVWRARVVERWTGAVEEVVDRTRRWSERDLDRYRLPHPLIGAMTVREILLFTLYHNAHHMRRIAERAPATEERHDDDQALS